MPGVAHLAEHDPRVRWAYVYIEEAHAENEWPIATPAEFAVQTQHETLADRQVCVLRAKAELPGIAGIPIYLDDMDQTFMRIYGAWPTQLFLFLDGAMVLKAQPQDARFDLMDFWSKAREKLGFG